MDGFEETMQKVLKDGINNRNEKEIMLEIEQLEIERLYGDRIKNFKEEDYLSGEELRNATLKILEGFYKTGVIKR